MRQFDRAGGFRRRTVLKTTAGVAGLTAVTGCLGDGGDGSVPGADGEMVMTTSTETTAAYSMSQVLANRVNQNSDLSVQARPSEGTNANIGRLGQNQSDISYIQNWTANKIAEEEAPFDELDFTPYQTFHLYDLAWFLCTANDGWDSVEDIQPDSRVSPTPRGSGTAEMLEYALGFVVDDFERISIDYGEQGGALSAGRLDVGAGTWVNYDVEPGWLQQMRGTVSLRVLQWPGGVVAELEDDPAIIMVELDTGNFEGYGYIPNPLSTPSLAYNFVVRDDFDGATLRTFLETLWNNRENLSDDNALLEPLEEGEFWMANGYSTLPFHPAAAEFYQEQGVWNDSYEIGEQ